MSTTNSATSTKRNRPKSFLTAFGTPQDGIKRAGKLNSRPNSRHVARHKHPDGFPQAPVDKLLFLQSRLHKGMSESAVLVSSEAGYLHFWSVYGAKHHKGSFYASHSVDEEESVLALATDDDNHLLLSGDTMGHLYVWDIEHHYTNSSQQAADNRPPLLHHWKAHDLAVVSIEYVHQNFGLFVVTASTDWTARLWTLEGYYIGTFGQEQPWSIRNPNTFQHPKTPWSYLEEAESPNKIQQIHGYQSDVDGEQGEDEDDETKTKNLDENQNRSNSTKNDQNQEQFEETEQKREITNEAEATIRHKSDTDYRQDHRISNNSVQMQYTDATDASNKSRQFCSSTNQRSFKEAQQTTDVLDNSMSSCSLDTEMMKYDSSKSTSVADIEINAENADKIRRSKPKPSSKHSLLGVQVEHGLSRITQSRQQRRQKFGDIDAKSTARFGKTCSPFQALSLLQTDTVSFPLNLPMTPSMLKRGMTCTTEKELRSLSLSPLPFGEVKGDKVIAKQEPLPAIGTNLSNQQLHRK